jgi:DNA-binding NarL/FixJ family response regulator
MVHILLKKRIVLIECDHELRNIYKLVINSSRKFTVVGDYSRCEEAIKDLNRTLPDIVLMDLDFEGMSGSEGIQRLKSFFPHLEVVIITIHDDTHSVYSALKAGASGYLCKDVSHKEILNSIEEVAQGGAPMSRKVARMIVEDFHCSNKGRLTTKELTVLRSLAQGKTYSRISDEMVLSKETVKSHMRNLYRKLNVHRKSDAIERAHAEGMI